ncbi:MAG: hypothetical protein O7D86_04175 [Proteobacteria bacterium]|nr:hypothetical protein [Pseudomonadota bacterium]
MSTEIPVCYMCDKPASSKEHVPPRCLFPERKDVGTDDFRKDLITVPSCDEHNSLKSDDDEFLMVSMAGIIGNNSIGYMHKLGKVDRAIKRSANRLIEKVFIKKRKYLLETDKNNFLEIIWGTPDHTRLMSCFKRIAYGIHLHHFSKCFHGEVKTILGYLRYGDNNSKNFVEFIKHKTAIELKDKQKYGRNQAVFFYQFTEPDQFGLYLVRLCFYGGIDVYIAFLPVETNPPVHLGFELMNCGLSIVIELEGKTYKINE